MDKLKQYLQENRSRLDTFQPDKDSTDIFLKKLGNKKDKSRYSIYWIAASVVFIFFLLGKVYYLKMQNSIVGPQQASVIESVKRETPNGEKSDAATIHEPLAVMAAKKATETFGKQRKESNLSKNLQPVESVNVDSMLLGYNQMVDKYLNEIQLNLASDHDQLKSISHQLMEIEKDEERIKILITQYGPEDNLLEALIRLNQQKIIYLKRIKQPLLKRKQLFKKI